VTSAPVCFVGGAKTLTSPHQNNLSAGIGRSRHLQPTFRWRFAGRPVTASADGHHRSLTQRSHYACFRLSLCENSLPRKVDLSDRAISNSSRQGMVNRVPKIEFARRFSEFSRVFTQPRLKPAGQFFGAGGLSRRGAVIPPS